MNLYISKEVPSIFYEDGVLPIEWDISGYKLVLIQYKYDTLDERLKEVDMSGLVDDLKRTYDKVVIKLIEIINTSGFFTLNKDELDAGKIFEIPIKND